MRTRPIIAATTSEVTVLALLAVPQAAGAATANLATFGVAAASSSENATVSSADAIDGDPATRWSRSSRGTRTTACCPP